MEQNENFEHVNDPQIPDVTVNEQADNIPEAGGDAGALFPQEAYAASLPDDENPMPKHSMVHEKEIFVPEDTAAVPPAAPLQEPQPPKREPSKTVSKPPKQKKKKERKPRRKHYVARFFAAIFRFLLTLLLGMTIAYGSIFCGVYYAISGLTLSDLQAMGIAEGVDAYLTDTGEVDLTTVSLLELIADFNAVRADLGSHTLQTLITRYGVVLPEETMKKLPTDLFSVPLNTLLSSEVGTVVAENLKMGYILSFLPEGTLSKEAIDTLAPRSISLLTEGKYGELLSGVKLGYVTGVKFNSTGDVVYENPYAPTAQEAMANLDLGTFFTAITQNGDILGAFATCLGDSRLKDVFSAVSGGALFDKMLAGRLVKDVIILDEQTGQYTLSFTALASGMYLGDALGYTLANGVWYSSYTDDGYPDNDERVGSMNAALAGIALSDVLDGKLNIAATFDGLFFGDLQNGYVRGDAIIEVVEDEEVIVGYKWTKNGETPSEVEARLANIAIADVLNGTIDINGTLGTLYLGDLQGYAWRDIIEDGTVVGHKWVKVADDLTETELSAMETALADISLSDALNGSLDVKAALGDLTLGDVQGFTLEGDGKWYKSEGTPPVLTYVGAVQNSLANTKLQDVLSGSFSISEAVSGLRLGDAMGYVRGDVITPADPLVPDSYDIFAFTKGTPAVAVTGAVLEVANMPLERVLNGEADFADTIKSMPLGEVLEYTKHGDVWYAAYTDDGNDSNDVRATGILSLLADHPVREINAATVDSLMLGAVLGYEHRDTDEDGEGDTWYHGDIPAEGLLVAFADLTVGQLSDPDMMVTKVRTLTLAEAMGYEQHGGIWYSQYSDDGNDTNDVRLTGILAVLAGKRLNEINSATIDGIKLGDALGYTYEDTNDDDVADTWCQDGAPATGMTATMADLTIGQLRNGETVTAHFGSVHLYDVLGYRLEDGSWLRNSDDHKASGIIAHLIGLTISEVEAEIDDMPLGYAFNFYRDENTGVWYTDAEHTVQPMGITAALADIHLSSARDEFESMKIGTLLGFVYVDTNADDTPDTWQKKGGGALTGLDLVFADMLVSDLGNTDNIAIAMQDSKLGDSMGFKKKDDKWYKSKKEGGVLVADTDKPVTGLFGALADSSIGSIEADVQTVQIGVMLNYYKDEGKWYDSEGHEVTGMITAIADSTLQTVATDFEKIEIGQLFSTRSGIMAALPATTKISELDSAVQQLTMGQLVGTENEHKAVTLEQEVINDLDNSLFMAGWRNMTLIDFLEKALDALSQMP
ncbi:MAG: hypothetical protein E7639_06585 [Ruminococcaceae bacterium]|nr:hypothetical protein [Oscillospiraceae bacterium]